MRFQATTSGKYFHLTAFVCCLATAKAETLIEVPTGQLPGKLSETGLLDTSQESKAILYEPRWPLWSNGSTKVRYIVLPPGTQVNTSNQGDWKFPIGTLFFKTFSFETQNGARPVETRLIRGLKSGWEFAVYRWDEDGSDATLINISSATPVELKGRDGKTIGHEIPNRLQCRQCHEANTNFIIGFTELNLNAPLGSETREKTRTQLEQLHERGLLTEFSGDAAEIEDDQLGSREIRGYVHANCVHCHNGRERVDLSHDVFLKNTVSKKTRGLLFPKGERIKPGHPEESLLYQAFARADHKDLLAVHMPPVGVQEADAAMIETLHRWITSLAGKDIPVSGESDVVSPQSLAKVKDREESFVPNRHASSIMNAHQYAFTFERIPLDGDHSASRGFTAIRFLPNTNLFLLAEHEGRINLYEMKDDKGLKRGEFRVPHVHCKIECGIVSMELDPDFATNSFVYVGYCYKDPTCVKVSRLKLDLDRLDKTPETLTDVVQVDGPKGEAWHTIGSILFDREKMMWVLFGERGLSSPAQDNDNLLGSVIRIIPNRDPDGSGYTTPPQDDSFWSWFSSRPRGELMAKGLRNPWTGTFDSLGRLWIGEVGQNFEEINILNPADGFHNFGWPHRDGQCKKGCRGTINPIISYTRDGNHPYAKEDPGTFPTAEQCVWIGPRYQPRHIDRYAGRLNNVMLFGDYILGWVRGLELNAAGEVADDRPLGNMPGTTSWCQGPDDYLYTSTFAAYTQDIAAVFKVVSTRSAR